MGLLVLATVARAGPPYRPLAYRHLGPWSDRDPERLGTLDIDETDLGVSFPYQPRSGPRQLVFLFGDTHPSAGLESSRWDEDAIARAPVEWRDRARLPDLNWLARPDGEFLSLLVPGEDLRGMEVPLDGVQVGGRVLLFFNADWDRRERRHRALVCAEARDGRFDRLTPRFRQGTKKFLNVSVSPDPDDPETIWIFGTGQYRRSPVYLAKAPAGTLDDFGTWQFRAGERWAAKEEDATPVVEGRLGELSARHVPAAGSWVMLYQRRLSVERRIHGVYARFAPRPTGPWSEEVALLKPDREKGVGFAEFLHSPIRQVGYCDGLAGSGRDELAGDAYGPYVVPEWCYVEDGRLHVVHTLSTWNPYRVSLMDAVLTPTAEGEATPAAAEEVPAVEGPLASKWTETGAPFARRRADGRDWLSLARGAGERSTSWVVGRGQRWLAFELRGEGITARLYDATGHRVRQSRGRATGDGGLKVRWRIDGLEGQRVVLTVTGKASSVDGRVEMTPPVFRAQP